MSDESLRAWFIQRLAALLRRGPDEIDPNLPFTDLGLDSLTAFSLTGELAYWLQRELPATLLWDFSTVEQLVQYLDPSSAELDRHG